MGLNREIDKYIPLFDNSNTPAFKKYLPISESDLKWGLVVNDLGHSHISKNSDYPTKGHPGTHMFSWETGRILHEYHVVFITKGKGIFESRSAGKINIQAGDGFVLFPGEWHRYKPLKETGWDESWMGFSGPVADIVMSNDFFRKEQPVVKKFTNMLVLNLFNTLSQLMDEEPFGYQRIASGVCIQLMAEVCNIQTGSETNRQASSLVSKAKYLMTKKINEKIDFHIFCDNHGISYSKFRADFKNQTGFAPMQYFLLVKIEKAKDLLNNTDLSAKQIAYRLGFKSDHYFGRIFKSRTGLTPRVFRMNGRTF